MALKSPIGLGGVKKVVTMVTMTKKHTPMETWHHINIPWTQRWTYGSSSSVSVHEMGLPRNAKKGRPREPGEESLEEEVLAS